MTGASENKNKIPHKFLKLVKNDFFASSRVISFMYLAIAVALVFFGYGHFFNKTNFIIGGMVGSVIISFALIIVTLIFVVYDFNKSLFGQQGYLSFSLPVTSNQLLGSKSLVYGLWMAVSCALFIGIMCWFEQYSQKMVIAEYGEENVEMVESLASSLLNLPSVSSMLTTVFFYILIFFAIIFAGIFMIYFALTLSHIRVFQKANIVWAVVIFVVECLIMLLLIRTCNEHIDFNFVIGNDGRMGMLFGETYGVDGECFSIVSILYCIIQCVVDFFATSFVMRKYINIK